MIFFINPVFTIRTLNEQGMMNWNISTLHLRSVLIPKGKVGGSLDPAPLVSRLTLLLGLSGIYLKVKTKLLGESENFLKFCLKYLKNWLKLTSKKRQTSCSHGL